MTSTAAATALPPNIFDPSAAPQQGARATESAHRKIELQDPADWTYLLANATDAARAKIDRHFPAVAVKNPSPKTTAAATATSKASIAVPSSTADESVPSSAKPVAGNPSVDAEEEKVVRERVVELVDEYLRATYDAAKPSVAINGMDIEEMEAELAKYHEGAELEPFDAKLAQRIQDLAAQVEEQTLALANLRRQAPQTSAQQFRTSFDTRSALFDERVRAGEAKQMEAAKATTVDVGPVPRAADMQEIYLQGTDGLNALKSGMGGAVARMEKARTAVEVLEEA